MNISSFLLRTLVIASLILPRSATCIADPMAVWLGPWAPTFDPIQTSAGLGADATAFRSFGPLGDGEPLSGTSARAFSRATADSATFGSASASTGLAFNRPFQLSGSPNGWDVTLSGRLVGLLFAASPTNPSASVFAGAEILAGGPSFLLGPLTIAPDRQRDVDVDQVVHGFLSDGTYTVIGFLRTTASVDATFNPFASGGARSDFASQEGQGFFVGVDATPVPEPSTFLLIGTGTLALAQVCRSIARKNASS